MVGKFSMEGVQLGRVQITNISHLEELASGDQQFITDMIELFVDQVPVYLKKIKYGLSQNDELAVRQTAHKLKSITGYFGLQDINDILRDLERVDRAKLKSSQVFGKFIILKNIFRIAVTELKENLNELKVNHE